MIQHPTAFPVLLCFLPTQRFLLPALYPAIPTSLASLTCWWILYHVPLLRFDPPAPNNMDLHHQYHNSDPLWLLGGESKCPFILRSSLVAKISLHSLHWCCYIILGEFRWDWVAPLPYRTTTTSSLHYHQWSLHLRIISSSQLHSYHGSQPNPNQQLVSNMQ